MRRKLLLTLIPLALLLLADATLQCTLLQGGYLRERRVAPFDPPLFNRAQQDALSRLASSAPDAPLMGAVRFDAELGWCVPSGGGAGDYHYDASGARIGVAPLARAKSPGVRRVVAIGCSFTHGDEVAAKDAWPAQLDAARADVEVANLGVGAYGIDQAWMRFLRDGAALGADEVWLGVMPSALPRCLSMYRPALRHHEVSVAFKPRYRLAAGGALVLVDHPAASIADVVRLLGDQRAFVAATGAHDFFVHRARTAYLPSGSHWTHWFAATRLLLTKHEGGARDPAPMLLDERSELHRVTRAIVQAAHQHCRESGAMLRVIVLPDQRSLAQRADGGARGHWDAWLATLAADGIAVHDTSAALHAAGATTDARHWCAGGHYTRAANAVVAADLAALLR